MTRVITAEFHGKKISMYDMPGKQLRALKNGSVYEQQMLEWVYEAKIGGAVVDAGANLGNHTLWFNKVCELRVHAFEPLLFDKLEANLDLNKVSNMRANSFGLSDMDGHLAMVKKGTLGVGKKDNNIPVKTLDSVQIQETVRLIKIDVEGMECNVLRGGLSLIQRDHPIIFTEEWTPSVTAQIGNILEPLGYRRIGQFGGKNHKGTGPVPVGRWHHG